MKVFYIGSAGLLSVRPFQSLLNTEIEICGVGLDRQPQAPEQKLSLAIDEINSLSSLAEENDIPVIDLKQSVAEVVSVVTGLQPDFILVSCYARRIVDELLNLPALGAFNIHPSLLPAFRGPVPLFWQFRQGVEQFGISLHCMTADFDAGPVICRQTTHMPDGLTLTEATDHLAGQIPALLDAGLPAIVRGDPGTMQDEVNASYQGYPVAADFAISTSWTARRAFNFMRATAHLGQPYECEISGRFLQLKHALSYSTAESARLSKDMGRVAIPCVAGTLIASYYQ